MAISIRDAGTLRTITRGKAKAAGVLRDLREIKVMDGGVLRTVATFADPLFASASPTSVSGTQSSAGVIAVNTGFTTATPTGGRAPFTYFWAATSGVAALANTPTSATTNFRAEIGPGTSVATFRVTITDAVGQTATADVTATFNNLGGGGFEP